MMKRLTFKKILLRSRENRVTEKLVRVLFVRNHDFVGG